MQTVKTDPLSELAFKYGTDKCPQLNHAYTPFYYELLKDKRQSIRKVLEMGIGNGNHSRKYFPHAVTGASLYMWRDFFPNAQIYGADNDPETMFTSERIETFLCDETKKEDILRLVQEIGTDIDLFIDDGSHSSYDQQFLCKTLLPLLKKDVIYIIEDVRLLGRLSRHLAQYDCQIPKLPPKPQPERGRDQIMIVKPSSSQKNRINQDQIIQDLGDIRRIRKHYVWEAFMRKYKCDYICELGVCKGKNFYEMIKHRPKLAVAVDSWVEDGTISRNDGRYSQKELDDQYQSFKSNVQDKPFVKIYKEYTFDAVKHFEDDYFDLVYIDADHTYEGCLRDIEDWFPKVKKGGFLLGDDYRVSDYRVKFGVIEAVNDFAQKNNLGFFVLPNYGWGIVKE